MSKNIMKYPSGFSDDVFVAIDPEEIVAAYPQGDNACYVYLRHMSKAFLLTIPVSLVLTDMEVVGKRIIPRHVDGEN